MSDRPSLDVRAAEVDRVGDLERRTFTVHVPAGLPYFEGHFRDHPVLPAVALLHDVVLVATRAAWPDLGVLRGITRLKFRRTIGPESDLTLRVERRAAANTVGFTIEFEGEATAQGALGFDASA